MTGAREALADVGDWADRRRSAHALALDELADTCAAMLNAQEAPQPRGLAPGIERRPIVQDKVNEREGGWDAADAAFADDMFKTGCFMFTQFYKGVLTSSSCPLRSPSRLSFEEECGVWAWRVKGMGVAVELGGRTLRTPAPAPGLESCRARARAWNE